MMNKVFPAFAMVVLFSFVVSAASKDMEGAVCVLLLDEGKGTTANDFSGNNNNATLEGGAKWVNGKYGSALEFDGVTGCAKVPDSDSLDLTEEMTIMAWVKRYGSISNRGFVTKVTFGGNNRSYDLGFSSDSPRFIFTADGTANTWNGVVSNVKAPEEEWTHAAGTYDGKTMKMYVNGDLSNTENVTAKIFPGTSPLALARHGADAQYVNVAIDEVAIFNRPLSGSEIKLVQNGLERFIAAVSPQGKLTTSWASVKNR